ncbi:hypothetical protein L6452_38599 [Arctium lappa]|uniref:Uncharacterized protein n=1 Tax=Arctium lappa TaxID=4217 RepID=A0ACB8XPK3_ARCLA|nr:hypothetical protein L6452_38599 [Arctium lappa]
MRKEIRKREEKKEENVEPKYGRCYNYGKPDHFSKECKFKTTKNSEYYAKKSLIAKKVEDGKELMAEEENWFFQSSDEESTHFTQVCMMAKVNDEAETSSDQSDCDSEVSTLSNSELVQSLMAQIQNMEKEFESLKVKLNNERQSMMNFRDENALLKVVVEEKESEKDALKKQKEGLKNKIAELEKDIVNLNSEKGDFKIKFEACFQERNEAYCKIKQLEDLNLKRGQTEQTLNLLTNKLQDVRFYNAKTGLGFEENDVFKRAPENLYNFDKLGSTPKKIPSIRDTFIKAETIMSNISSKGKEVIYDDTSSCDDSVSSFKSVGFSYKELNKSYKNKKPEFVEFQSLFSTYSPTESADTETEIPETQCQYDECESETDVENQAPLIESIISESSKEIKTDECIDTIEELEDENNDLRFKLDKSSEENKELYKELSTLKVDLFKQNLNEKKVFDSQTWNVHSNPEFETITSKTSVVYTNTPEYPPSIFEKGEASGISKTKSSSKKKTDNISFPVSYLKKQNDKGEWVKEKSENKVVDNKCNAIDSVSLKCTSSNDLQCQKCMNVCIHSDKSKLLTFAHKNFICKHCHGNSFKLHTIPPKSKVSRKASWAKSVFKSSTQHATVFHVKNVYFSRKQKFNELNVKMVWKWVPKPRYEWRIKAKVDDLNKLQKANQKRTHLDMGT